MPTTTSQRWLICRIGSLETVRSQESRGGLPYLPHRQLRNDGNNSGAVG
ncbi:hypothetical protein MITSMUL_05271 [Mitsuokella multacida DSM 20544]|uniref:Uncharacterized protein n=1 Tax=Mitsuokella multacida DSM 20544 TaxID=500635 RepID=C9KPW3_9FIRM|nr:hypothetical protein MITSMUL_05271 [Mitsuokella multacida DSM 20544]